MPLLNKKKFVRKKPPSDLNPNEEVFFCSATHEIFRNYEEFFERTILVNSLVWSCEVCGNCELTYEEAQECEANALQALSVFSKGLVRGLVCLVNLTYRSSFLFLVDDVFQFIKERYFIDESVDFTPPGQKKPRRGFVIGVNHPSSNTRILNGDCSTSQSSGPKTNGEPMGNAIDLTGSDDEIQIVGEEKSPVQAMAVPKVSAPQASNNTKNSPKSKQLKIPEPQSLIYVVRDDSSEGCRFLVPFANVQRKKGVMSKDRLRNFLRIVTEVKANCGYYRVNPNVVRRKFSVGGVSQLSWDTVFGGPVPQFVKAPLSSVQQGRLFAAAAAAGGDSSSGKHRGRKAGSGRGENKKGKHVDDRKKKKKKDNGASSPSDEKKLRQIADEAENARRKEKAAEMQREWLRLEQEMKRRETEKQARLAERERQREEKRLKEVLIKEWTRCRDDLACDDLRILPQPTRVTTKLHPTLFGDALTIVEFFACFMDVLKLRGDLRCFPVCKSSPPGTIITFRALEKALLCKNPNGALADMFFALLTAIQKLQQREDKDDQEIEDDDDDENSEMTTRDGESSADVPTTGVSSKRLYDAVRAATRCAKYPMNRFGEPLYLVQLDTMTLTEVLRLHLLSSGARVSQRLALFRWRRRGGMTQLDDPGLHFARTDPDGIELVSRLEKTNVFDLPAVDKLRLMKILVDQLLTYASARQAVDSSGDRVKALRAEYRSLMLSVQRSEKNLSTLRVRRKQAKKSIIEQAIAAGGLPNGNSAPKVTDEKEKENNKTSPPKALTMVTRNSSSGRKKKLEPVPELENPLTVDPKDITEELLEKARAAHEELKASVAEREPEIMGELLQAMSGCSGPVPLGRDRAYRRYWFSRHLSGLFVESPGIDSASERQALLVEARLCRQMSSDESRFNLHRHTKTADGSMKFVTSWDIKDQVADGHDVHTQWDQLVEDSCSGLEQWYFFPEISQLDELNASLNPRGIRESALRSTLNEFRSVLEEAIDYCPVADLLSGANEERRSIPREEEVTEKGDTEMNGEEKENGDDEALDFKSKMVTFDVKSRSRVVPGRASSDSASEWMELNLREALLDLEERIYAGALGVMKVTDRAKWREMIEKGSYDPCCAPPLENGEALQDVEDLKPEADIDEDSNATVEAKQEEIAERVVRDLSSALLQIATGIHARFIVAPLGDDDEATKEAKRKAKIQAKLRKRQDRERRERMRQESRGRKNKQSLEMGLGISSSSSEDEDEANGLSIFERWQQGLRQTTSLSQISLYLNALDRSILWSKSLLKARCKVCRKKGDDSQLLLCDSCDRGFHMYCLKPRLTKVPKGEWFCPGCRPPEPEPVPAPRSRGRKKFVESEEEEEEEDKDDEEDTEGGEQESGSDESTEGEQESEEDSSDENRATDDKENEDSEEEEESDEDEEEEDGRRRSGRVRKQTPKAMAAKVKLPLATPRTRRPQRKTVSASLSSRGRASLPAMPTGSRGRLKRGHPEGEALRDIEEILMELMRHDDAWPFMNPVRKADVPDYHDIIKHPMDLGSMRVNFTRLLYDSPQQPMNDLWRIVLNCEQYNHESSEEYQCSQQLRRCMEKRFRELGLTKLSEKAYDIVRSGFVDSTRSAAPARKRTRTN